MLQFLANGLCMGAVIAIVALGFGLIYTTTRVFHIAHGGVYVLTGYTLWVAIAWWGLPLTICIFLSLGVAALAGIVIDWTVYQPLASRSAPIAVVMISSLGIQIIFENAIALTFGNQTLILRSGIERTLNLGPVILTYVQLAQLIVGVTLTVALWLFLRDTRVGHIFRAVSDDEMLALVIGLRVTRVRLLVFALGSIFAGIGSILILLDVGLDPHAGFPAVLAAAVACIIGGLRNFLAPVAGGFFLGIVQSLTIWQTSAKWKEAITFGLLIIFILLWRQGLLGIYKRAEEA